MKLEFDVKVNQLPYSAQDYIPLEIKEVLLTCDDDNVIEVLVDGEECWDREYYTRDEVTKQHIQEDLLNWVKNQYEVDYESIYENKRCPFNPLFD